MKNSRTCKQLTPDVALQIMQGETVDEHFLVCSDCIANQMSYVKLSGLISRALDLEDVPSDWYDDLMSSIEEESVSARPLSSRHLFSLSDLELLAKRDEISNARLSSRLLFDVLRDANDDSLEQLGVDKGSLSTADKPEIDKRERKMNPRKTHSMHFPFAACVGSMAVWISADIKPSMSFLEETLSNTGSIPEGATKREQLNTCAPWKLDRLILEPMWLSPSNDVISLSLTLYRLFAGIDQCDSEFDGDSVSVSLTLPVEADRVCVSAQMRDRDTEWDFETLASARSFDGVSLGADHAEPSDDFYGHGAVLVSPSSGTIATFGPHYEGMPRLTIIASDDNKVVTIEPTEAFSKGPQYQASGRSVGAAYTAGIASQFVASEYGGIWNRECVKRLSALARSSYVSYAYPAGASVQPINDVIITPVPK